MVITQRALVNSRISKNIPKKQKSIRVLVFGAFDILHPGHRNFFRQAKKYGTELIVAVGRDHVVHSLKGRRPEYSEKVRLAKVAAEPLVDRAVLASRDPRRRFVLIKKLRPHIIGLGHDQTHYTEKLEQELQQQGIRARVVRLRPWRRKTFRSSLLRKSNNRRFIATSKN